MNAQAPRFFTGKPTTVGEKHAQVRASNEVSQRNMTTQFLDDRRRTLKIFENDIDTTITPAHAVTTYQAALTRSARTSKDRSEQNSLIGQELLKTNERGTAFREIDASLSKDGVTLADEGRAALARSSVYYGMAQGMIPSDQMGRLSAAAIHNEGMVQEVRGIVALEGREGLLKRTGLSEDKIDAFALRAGAGGLMARFETGRIQESDAEPKGMTAQEHQDAWAEKAAGLGPDGFKKEVNRHRLETADKIFPKETLTDADTRTRKAALVQFIKAADEEGLTSKRSRLLTTRLEKGLEKGSQDRMSMECLGGVLSKMAEARSAQETR
jgi:hypothetical protein